MSFKPAFLFIFIALISTPGITQQAKDSLIVRPPVMIDLPEIQPAKISDSWWTGDKAQHFAGSFICTVFLGKLSQQQFAYTVPQAQMFGGGITFALGLGKEIHDARNPNNIFSVKDLVADIAGIAAGIILLEVK